MGCGLKIFLMISLIITFCIFLFLSFQSAYFLFHDGSLNAAEKISLRGWEKLYFNGGERENGNANWVSSKDKRDEKGRIFMVEKFRALLGVKRFNTERQPFGLPEYFPPSPSPSPSPSASEAQAPSRAPSVPTHPRSHHPSPHNRAKPRHSTLHEEANEKSHLLVALLVPAGILVLGCVLGFVCFCGKTRKHDRIRNVKNFLTYGRQGRGIGGRSKYASTRNSASKVGFNPGLDLFYLESLGVDLEQESFKQSSGSVTNSSFHSTTYQARLKTKVQNQEAVKLESDSTSGSSSTREITAVHGDAESVKCDPAEDHPSDDESFHSFGDSHSPKARVSDALNCSPRKSSEILSQNSPKAITLSLADSMDASNARDSFNDGKQVNATYEGPVECQMTPIAQDLSPPPPPPPPPTLPSQLPRLHFSYKSCSGGIARKSPPYPTHNELSPSRNSDPCSGSESTPKSELAQLLVMNPKPAQCPPGIPLPPCPPPFYQGNTSFEKSPPPPPSQLPQLMPTMGKDGAPLPKLKPLHWDKVRATPDRSMVWDKLRSSSFE